MLGDALVTSGAITSPQLEAALDRQRVTGTLLGETLLGLELISQATLSRALAEQAGVPFVAITDLRPDRAAAALVPEPFARKHLLVPVDVTGSILEVVQANPLDVLPLDDLRQFASRPVSAICAAPEDVRTLLDWCYADAEEDHDNLRAPTPETLPTSVVHADDAAAAPTFEIDAPRVRPLGELGFTRNDLSLVTDLLNGPRGLLIVAGPDEARKTTIYSMLTHLARTSKNIVTIEDTIECQIPGVRQTQRDPSTSASDVAALRSMLRQYPDAIMLSDIGDAESAAMALRAAQSGIHVLTTLNERDATSAVARLIDMRLEPYLLASYLTGVIAQRVVRLICTDCREPITYPAEMLKNVGLAPDPDVLFVRGRGCEHCGGSGYRGYTGVYEILLVDSPLQALIRDRADARAIARAAAAAGLKPLFEDALARAILQQTTLEEVARLATA